MDTIQPPINRDYVRLLMVMRRFIKEEFNLSIRISEDDAAAQMLEYGAKSRNHVLREMAIELRQMIAPTLAETTDEKTANANATPAARYRGVVVHQQDPGTKAEDKSKPKTGGDKILRVYRGRPIYE
jgi:hypothetical protein